MKRMMKRYVVSFSVLGVLAVALALLLVVDGAGDSPVSLPEIDRIEIDNVVRIEIENNSRADPPVVFEVIDGEWRIQPEGYRADQELIRGIAGNIAALRLTGLVSVAGDLSRYDLDDAKRIDVVASLRDGSKRTVFVGKSATTLDHTYISIEGDRSVYQAVGNLKPRVALKKEQYRDMRILPFEPDTVTRLDFRESGDALSFSLEKKTDGSGGEGEATWTADFSGGETAEIKTADVDLLVGFLSNLVCTEYYDELDNSPKAYMHFTLRGESDITLTIYPVLDGSYPAVSSKAEYPFELASWRISQIRQRVDTIRESGD